MRVVDMMEAAARPFRGTSSDRKPSAPPFPEPLDAAWWSQEIIPPPEQILVDAVDVGAKTVIVAPSKGRKSFFLLQFALAVAAGLAKFLLWEIYVFRRVLLVQLEITPPHFHGRLCRMMRGMGIGPEDLGDRLHILNGRSGGITLATMGRVVEMAKQLKAEMIVIDPIYKLLEGDENKAEDVKPLLAMFDRIATETGAAVVFAHHTGKGVAGDRQVIDLAVGSGVLARDFDTQISLLPHDTEGLLVCEQIARSYPPRPATSLAWDNDAGCFVVHDTAPICRTSQNRNRSGRPQTALTEEHALAALREKPLPGEVFMEALDRAGFSQKAARAMRDRLLDEGKIQRFREPKFMPTTYYGTPMQIEVLRDKWRNPDLPNMKKGKAASEPSEASGPS